MAEEVRSVRMLDVQALVILQKSPQERDQNHAESATIVRPECLRMHTCVRRENVLEP